jgi:hypothetical protein
VLQKLLCSWFVALPETDPLPIILEVENWQISVTKPHPVSRRRIGPNSSSESLRSPSLRFCRLYRSIPWRRAGFEGMEKTSRDRSYFIHRRKEARFICLGRLVNPTDFSYELERGCPHLFRSNGRLEVEKSLYVSAHGCGPSVAKFKRFKRK